MNLEERGQNPCRIHGNKKPEVMHEHVGREEVFAELCFGFGAWKPSFVELLQFFFSSLSCRGDVIIL